MSVFVTIKDTIQTVQQDISAGLNLIKGKESKLKTKAAPVVTAIDLDAGADILYKYREVWKEIRKATEDTARRAEEADGSVYTLGLYYEKNFDSLNKFHGVVRSLPSLLELLQQMTDLLASLEESYDGVEAALIQLEDVIEQQELDRNKEDHCHQLAVYRKKKTEELEKILTMMSADYEKKLQEHKKRKQSELQERQATFEEAFQSDLDYYRTHGKMERMISCDSSKNLDLADITIDQDDDALNLFLASTDVTPSNERPDAVTPSSDRVEILSPSSYVTPVTEIAGIFPDDDKLTQEVCNGTNSRAAHKDSGATIGAVNCENVPSDNEDRLTNEPKHTGDASKSAESEHEDLASPDLVNKVSGEKPEDYTERDLKQESDEVLPSVSDKMPLSTR